MGHLAIPSPKGPRSSKRAGIQISAPAFVCEIMLIDTQENREGPLLPCPPLQAHLPALLRVKSLGNKLARQEWRPTGPQIFLLLLRPEAEVWGIFSALPGGEETGPVCQW